MMAKRDKNDRRRPKEQQSPYEFIRWAAAQDKRTRHMGDEKVEKCEDDGCDCPLCRAEQSGIMIDPLSMESVRRSMREAIMDMGGLRMPGVYMFGLDRADLAPPKAESAEDVAKRARARLEAEVAAARELVKDFVLEDQHDVSWEDVVGNEEAHRAMIEAIEFPLKHAALFAHYGKKPTKGILLKGPPGCGKTMFGKAAASVVAKLNGTKTATMLNVPSTKLQSPYIGKTEQMIRNIFAYARAYKKLNGHQLVVFIDEADAILPARGGSVGSSRGSYAWEESNVATFLSEMDGLEESGALIILATNRPYAIDAAVLRDGRIDRKITVQRPSEINGRLIFERAFRKAPVYQNDMVFDKSGNVSFDYHKDLIDRAMTLFFDPTRHLLKVKHEKGTDFLTMADVVSGAMMVGLVERIKANAFHRDVVSGEVTGIMSVDVVHAVERLTEEQREAPDMYALNELAQRINAPLLEVDQIRKAEIKFTGTLQ